MKLKQQTTNTVRIFRTTILLATAAASIVFATMLLTGCRHERNQTMERTGVITFKGAPLTLLGSELKVGDKAPDVQLVANDLSPAALSSYKGKIVILSAVPSLDTPVCAIETRRFNAEAVGLGADVVVLTVSVDLPFAQKRYCGAEGIDRVVTLSDYKSGEFGLKYGVMIKELRLLAREIFVLDKDGVIRYIQIVKEVSHEPDYAAVLDAVKKLK
jgi:thiol peroxidase